MLANPAHMWLVHTDLDAANRYRTKMSSRNQSVQLAQSQISSFSAGESRIRDADIAAEAANLTKAQTLQQATVAAMSQANSAPQALMSLFR